MRADGVFGRFKGIMLGPNFTSKNDYLFGLVSIVREPFLKKFRASYSSQS